MGRSLKPDIACSISPCLSEWTGRAPEIAKADRSAKILIFTMHEWKGWASKCEMLPGLRLSRRRPRPGPPIDYAYRGRYVLVSGGRAEARQAAAGKVNTGQQLLPGTAFA